MKRCVQEHRKCIAPPSFPRSYHWWELSMIYWSVRRASVNDREGNPRQERVLKTKKTISLFSLQSPSHSCSQSVFNHLSHFHVHSLPLTLSFSLPLSLPFVQSTAGGMGRVQCLSSVTNQPIVRVNKTNNKAVVVSYSPPPPFVGISRWVFFVFPHLNIHLHRNPFSFSNYFLRSLSLSLCIYVFPRTLPSPTCPRPLLRPFLPSSSLSSSGDNHFFFDFILEWNGVLPLSSHNTRSRTHPP